MSQGLANKNDKINHPQSACWETWPKTFKSYAELVCDHSKDSYYLREHGLKRNLVNLIGDCDNLRVLDVGSGNAWLLDELKPREGYACDIVKQQAIPKQLNFSIQDVRSLSYHDNFFDVVAASLLLIWLEEIDTALREIHRVQKVGSKLVISLVHPYFYRIGEPDQNGNFIISKDLSKPFKIEGLKIGGIAGPLTYFYRPFPDYLNACIRTGFRITKVLDWFIDMKDYEVNTVLGMDSKILRTGKVPLYSFIECKKE